MNGNGSQRFKVFADAARPFVEQAFNDLSRRVPGQSQSSDRGSSGSAWSRAQQAGAKRASLLTPELIELLIREGSKGRWGRRPDPPPSQSYRLADLLKHADLVATLAGKTLRHAGPIRRAPAYHESAKAATVEAAETAKVATKDLLSFIGWAVAFGAIVFGLLLDDDRRGRLGYWLRAGLDAVGDISREIGQDRRR